MDGVRLSSGVELKKIIFHLSRFLLGMTFIYASYHKILDPGKFAKFIYNYKIFSSHTVVNLLAIFLPWLELFAGISLIAGIFKKGASTIITALLVVFILSILYTMYMGIDTACGCFNFSEASKTGVSLLLRDFFFIFLSIYVTIYSHKNG